jgi:flagellar hook-length control protein FliK
MMQNSPFLVTQTSPAKNATTSNASKQTSEQGESFKQVLSKQVEQDDAQTKRPLDKPAEEKVKNEDKHASLKDKSTGTEAQDDERYASLIASASEETVDAQLLASVATAKTVQDVTDGEVVLDALPEVDAAKLPIATFTPVVQPNAAQKTVLSTEEPVVLLSPEDALAPTKEITNQPSTELTSDAIVKDKATVVKASQQTDALVEKDRTVNSQFANYLPADKNSQTLQESSVSRPTPSLTEATSIATATMQAIPKTTTTQTMPLEQVGFSNSINAYPGKTGWNEAIGQKVVWMVGAAEQSATLTLNPKDLGPLQVIINVNNEKADATFISENPEVRKALEEGMSSLKQSMSQAGVELGQANVNTSKQHQEFQQASKEYSAGQAKDNNAPEGADDTGNLLPRTRTSNGLVDTFV